MQKPIQYSDEERLVGLVPAVGAEDPAVTLKRMMDAIPTVKDDVFAYAVRGTFVCLVLCLGP